VVSLLFQRVRRWEQNILYEQTRTFGGTTHSNEKERALLVSAGALQVVLETTPVS
jgi:hypothetical protein